MRDGEPGGPMMEVLEPRILLSITWALFNETAEGAFPSTNWQTNVSQSRQWDDVSYKAHNGSWSAFCADPSDGSSSSTYVNNMTTTLSRTVNLTDCEFADLGFWYWMNTENNYDFFRVKVNGNTLWATSGSQKSWTQNTVSLNAYAGMASVTLGFEFTSDGSVVPSGDAGVWLDDIVLTGGQNWPTTAPVGWETYVNQFGDASFWVNAATPGWLQTYRPVFETNGSIVYQTFGDTDTRMAVYESMGIVVDDDSGVGTNPLMNYVWTGTSQAVSVRGHDSTTTGRYQLSIDGPAPTVTPLSLDSATLHGAVSSDLSSGMDFDFYSFTATQTGEWMIEADPQGLWDVTLMVYDPAGEPIGGSWLGPINNRYDGGTERWKGTLTAGQTYFLRIDGPSNLVGAQYVVSVQGPKAVDTYPGIPDNLLTANGYQLTDATGAVITTIRGLVDQYRPLLKFDAGELWTPKEVEIWGSHSPMSLSMDGDYTLGVPSFSQIADYNDGNIWIDLPGGTMQDVLNYYWTIDQNYSDIIYASVVKDPNSDVLALEYWFGYYGNNWANEHEADWEGICLYFDKDGPFAARYYEHTGGANYWWDDLEHTINGGTYATHPVVYVADGSHASHPHAGVSWPTTELLGFELPTPVYESHEGDGTTLYPSVRIMPRDFTVDLSAIDGHDMNWVKYSGHWGQQGLEMFGPNFGNDGPTGPSTKGGKWESPYDSAPALPDLSGYCDVLNDGAPFTAGQNIQIQYYIDNTSTNQPLTFQAKFYLSRNSEIDEFDCLLGTVGFSNVTFGNVSNTATFALPGKALYRLGWPYANGDGVYYVGMIVDTGDTVREKNEGNNRNFLLNDDVTVNNTYYTSDLYAVSSTYSPTLLNAGDPLAASWTVGNAGPGDMNVFYVTLYASTDQTYDGGDHYLMDQFVGELAHGQQTAVDLSIDEFPDLAPGSYYLCAYINQSRNGNESNWVNNWSVNTALYPFRVNGGPTLTGIPDRTLAEDGSLNNTLDLWSYASDAESADSGLTFSITGNTEPLCGVTLDGNRYIDVAPNHNWYGASDITITVSDGHYAATDTFRVTVTSVNDPPTLAGLPDRTLTEDTVLAHAIHLWDYADDVEGDAESLTYSITGNTNPGCGASITGNEWISIQPAAGWNGISDVTVRVSDGSLTATDVFRITVAAVNDPPRLDDLPEQTTNEDVPLNDVIDLWAYAQDPETPDAGLLFSIVYIQDTNCGANIDGNRYLDFFPTANWFGSSRLTLQVSDGQYVATNNVSIIVNSVEDDPGAYSQSVAFDEDASADIRLTGSDAETPSERLRYLIMTDPQRGSLRAEGPDVHYVPQGNFNGTDSFTFIVIDDGDPQRESPPATVTLKVHAVNDAPGATGASIETDEDTEIAFNLGGTDVETPVDQLIFTVTAQPRHGALDLRGREAQYRPDRDYNGSDQFSFTVRDTGDGKSPALTSAEAVVLVTVNPVNDAPTAANLWASTDEDRACPIYPTGTDVETPVEELVWTVVDGPRHGTIELFDYGIKYRPEANYYGVDTLTYVVTDTGDGGGRNFSPPLESAPATVTITVNPVNDAPTAEDSTCAGTEDCAMIVAMAGGDMDGPSLSFIVVAGPSHGSLGVGSGATRSYVPEADYFGADSFTFNTYDGFLYSAVHTVTINLAAANDNPLAMVDRFTLGPNSAGNELDVLVNDLWLPDGPETLTVVDFTPAAHGTVNIIDGGLKLVYTPDAGHVGRDLFDYGLDDGNGGSDRAKVELVVAARGDANFDMRVDGGDLALWQQHYDPLGRNANKHETGDWNSDGKVNGADLALWQQNYNPLGLSAVSEPEALAAETSSREVVIGELEPVEFVAMDVADVDTAAPLTGQAPTQESQPIGAPDLPALEIEAVAGSAASPEVSDGQASASEDGLVSLAMPESTEEQPSSALVLSVTPADVASSAELSPATTTVQGGTRTRAYRPAVQPQPSEQSVEDILALAVLSQTL